MKTENFGSPFLKFAAWLAPVKVLKLRFELVTLMPLFPPSPKYTILNVEGELLDMNVPLSCVPPTSFALLSPATLTLWNWSVERPTLRLLITLGTEASNCLQVARSMGANGAPKFRLKLSHWLEISV
jgi:hypothetical protein